MHRLVLTLQRCKAAQCVLALDSKVDELMMHLQLGLVDMLVRV